MSYLAANITKCRLRQCGVQYRVESNEIYFKGVHTFFLPKRPQTHFVIEEGVSDT